MSRKAEGPPWRKATARRGIRARGVFRLTQRTQRRKGREGAGGWPRKGTRGARRGKATAPIPLCGLAAWRESFSVSPLVHPRAQAGSRLGESFCLTPHGRGKGAKAGRGRREAMVEKGRLEAEQGKYLREVSSPAVAGRSHPASAGRDPRFIRRSFCVGGPDSRNPGFPVIGLTLEKKVVVLLC